MSDTNLTIGAVFDKAQLDSAMAEGSAAIQAIPDTFNLAFKEMSATSQRAMAQISSDTKAAAVNISDQWKTVANATAQYNAALKEVRAATRLVASDTGDQAASLDLLAAAKKRAAEASTVLSKAEKDAAGTASLETKAADTLSEALSHLRERVRLTSEGLRGSLVESGGFSSALGGALGIAIIGEYVDKVKEGAMQLNLLSQASGVSVQSLARLQAAFQLQGVQVDNFTQVLTRLAEHVVEAQEGDKTMADYFAALGVSASELTNPATKLDALLQTIATHLQKNAGNSQDLGVAYALLGRGAGQFVAGLQGLNSTLELHKDHVDSLAASYTDAASSASALDESEKSFSQTLSRALLPILGPVSIGVKAFGSALAGLWLVVEGIGELLFTLIGNVVNGFAAIGSSISDLISGNFSQAAVDAKKYLGDMGRNWKDAWQDMKQDALQTWADVKHIWSEPIQPSAATALPPPLPGKHTDANKTAMEGFEAELAMMKQNHQVTLQEELSFWQSKLSLVKQGSAQYLQILKIEGQLTQEIAKQENAAQLAEVRARIAADADMAKQFKADGAAAIKDLTDDINKRAKAIADAQALKIEGAQQAALAEVELEQRKNDGLFALGMINAQQHIASERQTEDTIFAINKAALEAKIAMLRAEDPDYPKQRQALLNQIAALEQKHAASVLVIAQQSAEARKKALDTVFGTINRSLDQSLRGVLMGTQTMSQAFRRMGADMVASFAENMLKMGLKFLETHLLMRAISAQTAQKQAVNDAANAFSGAYKATVGIPIIGPILAPIAGAAAFAAVSAEGALVSASGGQWEVPGAQQLTMIHQSEMVLPARYAEPLRRTVEGGGAGGGDVHLHVHATDADSVQRLFERNGRLIGQIVRKQARLGAMA